jgi:hypothetical protein
MSKSFEDIYRGLNYDLIKHYEQGVSDERERIIKLLENQHNFDQIFLDAVTQVIAIIKGENKE